MAARDDLRVRRTLEFVRALVNYIDDVIGHGKDKLDYFALLERDLGPMSVTLIWRILDDEQRIEEFGAHWRRWRKTRRGRGKSKRRPRPKPRPRFNTRQFLRTTLSYPTFRTFSPAYAS